MDEKLKIKLVKTKQDLEKRLPDALKAMENPTPKNLEAFNNLYDCIQLIGRYSNAEEQHQNITYSSEDRKKQLREQIEKMNEDYGKRCKQHERDYAYSTISGGRRVYIGHCSASMNIFKDICDNHRERVTPLLEELARLEGRPVPEKKILSEEEKRRREEERQEYSDWVERCAINHGG